MSYLGTEGFFFFFGPVCFPCNSKSCKIDLVELEVYLHGWF